MQLSQGVPAPQAQRDTDAEHKEKAAAVLKVGMSPKRRVLLITALRLNIACETPTTSTIQTCCAKTVYKVPAEDIQSMMISDATSGKNSNLLAGHDAY